MSARAWQWRRVPRQRAVFTEELLAASQPLEGLGGGWLYYFGEIKLLRRIDLARERRIHTLQNRRNR